MKDLKGKVAVVTGAASGLGRSMALAFASEGMDVALADVDQTNLSSVADEVQAKGVRAITLKVDVSQAEQVEALRDHALARLGAIHVVCNNAGVSPLGAVWESTPADWQWTLGVNLWGVILVSLLLGAGLATPAVLATDAMISIVIDVAKAALFQRFDLLDTAAFFTGLVIGVASIPGSAIAAWLVSRMGARLHVLFMEVLILFGGASMLWHAWR